MKRKRIAAIVFSVLVFLLFLPVLPSEETQAANGVYTKLMSLKNKFPDGKYWNHIMPASEAGHNCSNEAYADQVTSSPCLSHTKQVDAGNYDCNYFDGGLQCCGFAKKVFYDMFGERESSNSLRRIYSSDGLRVGDYVRFTFEHYAIVLSVSGSTFTVVECNLDQAGQAYNCIIRWGREYKKSDISYYVHSNNWDYINRLGGDDVSVSFSPWYSEKGWTYRGATDASIGQSVVVSGGSWTGVGMILYDNSGNELGRAGDAPTVGIAQYYYKINEELHVTLTPATTYKYRFYADVSEKRYYSDMQSFDTVPLGATFSPWESAQGRTYIGETDASIGQRVDVSGGSWTGVGMILYDSNRNELGRAGDTPTAGVPQYYYKINEELHVTLKHATSYLYRFYAVVDGNTYLSDYQSFTTAGSHSWDSGKVTTEPTTISEGVKTYTCTQCGLTRTEKISILNPEPEPERVVNWANPYSRPSKYSALVGTTAYVDSTRAFSEASIKVWDSNDNLVATKVENDSTNNTTALPIWYDIYSETGSLLSPATKYTYQIAVVVDNKEYQSPVWSFTTEGENDRHYGIDVSSHQGTIDWKTAADYIDFAIIRCGYGGNFAENDDTQWLNNVKACEDNKIPYGVYLYSYAENTEEAAGEAAHVIRLLEGHTPSLPVYLDLEDNNTVGRLSNTQIAEQVKTFCDKVKAAGYDVGVYASKSWWDNRLTSSDYNQYEKWVAAYTGTYAAQSVGVDMWQYASSGKVPGISNRVDLNYRNVNVTLSDPLHVHSLFKTDAVKATCTKAGNSAYWTCSGCGQYFSDADGTKAIVKNSWIIGAKGHKFVSDEKYCINGCGTINPDYSETPFDKTNISSWKVTGIKDLTFTGKPLKQKNILVSYDGEYADFSVKYKNNVYVGTATITIKGTGDYTGTIVKTFRIAAAKNPIKVKTNSIAVKYKNLKKKNLKFNLKAAVEENAQTVFKLSSVSKKAKKYIKVNSAGKVKVKKGLAKGKYNIVVTVTANATENYQKTTITKKIKLIVK